MPKKLIDRIRGIICIRPWLQTQTRNDHSKFEGNSAVRELTNTDGRTAATKCIISLTLLTIKKWPQNGFGSRDISLTIREGDQPELSLGTNSSLRVPHRNDAKIAKICNLWFWTVIQLIYHLFKIQKKAFLPNAPYIKKCKKSHCTFYIHRALSKKVFCQILKWWFIGLLVY